MFSSKLMMLVLFLSLSLSFAFAGLPDSRTTNGRLLSGFAQEIRGENIGYRSFHPGVKNALLTRCENGKQVIEWKTSEIPRDLKGGFATFGWIAAHSSGTSTADATFHLSINGTEWFKFTTVKDHRVRQWTLKGKDGAELSFDARMEDSVNDLFGFVFLKVPIRDFPRGKALTISVVGDSANRSDWYMTFKHSLADSVSIQAQPALMRTPTGEKQEIDVLIEYSQLTGSVDIAVPGQKPLKTKLELGYNSVPFTVDAVKDPREMVLDIAVSGQPAQKKQATLRPVAYREFWLLPHSHNDIGYSDLQADVAKKQLKNLRDAMQLCKQTASYPKEARFKWNTEILWAVDSFLTKAPEMERNEFIGLVKEGSIGLNGLYTNELTGLCRPEELLQLTEYARSLEKTYGVEITDAMISDVPGITWATVPALVQGGIRYFSSGPNYMSTLPDHGDRVGSFVRACGDKPFYWISPSGADTLLFWTAGRGYSSFHDMVIGKAGQRAATRFFDYLKELDAAGYPYDMVQVRYTTVSDNGPTDPDLPDFVRSWNEKYATPRLILATGSQMFKEFERRWATRIPSYHGDITPYWEDGALSTLSELGKTRRASELLVQTGVLASMKGIKDLDWKKFDDAWKNVLLFDEHTWGASNSVSEPESPFAISQWRVKQRFALDGEEQSALLYASILSPKPEGNAVDVINTSSWKRTDLVVTAPGVVGVGYSVVDDLGASVLSQRLSNGGLAFLAKDVPPLGARRYFLKAGNAMSSGAVKLTGAGIGNGLISLKLDPRTGAIRSYTNAAGYEFVDTAKLRGLNQYFYVPGRDPDSAKPNHVREIIVKEAGPLVGTLRIVSDAPGCGSLIQEITLVDGLARAQIVNMLDKSRVRSKESVHFAFPMRVPDGVYHLDGGWGVVQPKIDQLPGSCMDFLSTGRWLDVSNASQGMTWTTIESPLVEFGRMTDERPGASGYRVWQDSLNLGPLFYSYVMNNYWHTNYAASQEGPVAVTYALYSHGAFDAAEAYRRGIEQSQPLLVRQAAEHDSLPASLFSLSTGDVVTTSVAPSRDGKAVMVRLFNASSRSAKFAISWGSLKPKKVFTSTLTENRGTEAGDAFGLHPFQILTLRCER